MAGRPAVNLLHLPTTTSTMDVLDDLVVAGAPEWTVVLADEQTAGRGRAGRRWDAAPGSSLLCSVLIRPRATSLAGGMIAIGAGVAVARLIEELGVEVRLKWPNDVLLDGRKLGGVLIRTRRDAAGPAVNVGIGFNLRREHGGSLADRAALGDCLATLPSPVELMDGLTVQLDSTIHGGDACMTRDAWMGRAAHTGEIISVAIGDDRVTGVMKGIGVGGELIVLTDGGLQRSIVAGDLVRGPRPEMA